MSWSSNVRAGVAIAILAWSWPGPTEVQARGLPIPVAFATAAETQGVPPALFYAIAMQESGRLDPSTKRLRPWPWSLNVGGEARYFPTMEKAWTALGDAFAGDPRAVDIGLVQVSWPVNRHIIHDPYMALEPSNNLAIGAQILRECFDRLGDWWAAVGCYHSPVPGRAQRYLDRVRRHWLSLVEPGSVTP